MMDPLENISRSLHADGTAPTRDRIDAGLEEAALIGGEKTRNDTAEGLLALIFALRPSDDERGQAWCARMAATMMARAILGSIGPRTDPEPALVAAFEDVRTSVMAAQSAALRTVLRRAPGGRQM